VTNNVRSKTGNVDRNMKATPCLVVLTIYSLLTGCATCRPKANEPPASSIEEASPKAGWPEWLFEQVVNNAVSWAIWH
jgi:hypothetical protein